MKLQWLVPSVLGLLLLSTPANAAKFKSWHFDSNQNRLKFVTDDSVRPKVKLIANPTRLVIDLPNTKLGRPKINQPMGSKIRTIRIGQLDPRTTRLVIEFAPGYAVEPGQLQVRAQSSNHWFVQLPKLQFSQDSVFNEPIVPPKPIPVLAPIPSGTLKGVITPGRELAWLQQRLQALKAEYPFLQTGMFFVDMDTGNYLDMNGSKVFSAASTIKLPVLLAFFQDVDAGKVRLNETLVMRPELIASGSGTMQYLPAWSKLSAIATATKMIVISDNTATNMIIKRLGGPAVLNRRFRSWGLQDTVIRRWLPDLSGKNTTTAKDLSRLLGLLATEQLLSPNSRAKALAILHRTKNRSLLPAGLGPGARIAHKTGDIGFIIGDAGLIKLPNGKRYIGTVFVRRPYNDIRGRNFIRRISKTVYAYLSQPTMTSWLDFPTANLDLASEADDETIRAQ